MTAVNHDLCNLLAPLGLSCIRTVDSGFICADDAGTCVIIDVGICDLVNYQYVDYTSIQNSFFHQYDRVFRFLYDSGELLDELLIEIQFFLDGGGESEQTSSSFLLNVYIMWLQG